MAARLSDDRGQEDGQPAHAEDPALPGDGGGGHTYGSKSVDRIANQSMSKICNLWRLIVIDCDYAESYGRFPA